MIELYKEADFNRAADWRPRFKVIPGRFATHLTHERWKQSYDKWCEIVDRINRRESPETSFFEEYWKKCGFCKAAQDAKRKSDPWRWSGHYVCDICPLHDAHEGRPICNATGASDNWAIEALRQADDRAWDKALMPALIVRHYIEQNKP